ncbi:Metal tolerance protein 1 [Vitis vinifera]|uniref:Metal tolerance protein 1 n=1 Tax=Vitis vinifera TaxID=29760 RepID=A0A438IFG6_VITVI|nr:Metal tolerance protein 1 [Vitis vinifera]
MEAQNPQHSQIIEISVDVPAGGRSTGASKICGEAPCGFSDSGSSSKDAKERSASMRKLLIAVILCAVFMSVEVAGGIKANSLAILTDAAHLLSDVAAFAISLFSLWATGWKPLLVRILVYEAIVRLIHDTGEVNGFLMFLVATFGLVVNIMMAFLLGHDHAHGGHGHDHGHSHNDHDHGHGHSHGMKITTHHHHHHEHHSKDDEHHSKDDEHHHTHEDPSEPLLKNSSQEGNQPECKNEEKRGRNINVQGAYLHVLGDSIQSIGVMIGGAIIWIKPDWKIVDLICTLIFSVIVWEQQSKCCGAYSKS